MEQLQHPAALPHRLLHHAPAAPWRRAPCAARASAHHPRPSCPRPPSPCASARACGQSRAGCHASVVRARGSQKPGWRERRRQAGTGDTGRVDVPHRAGERPGPTPGLCTKRCSTAAAAAARAAKVADGGWPRPTARGRDLAGCRRTFSTPAARAAHHGEAFWTAGALSRRGCAALCRKRARPGGRNEAGECAGMELWGRCSRRHEQSAHAGGPHFPLPGLPALPAACQQRSEGRGPAQARWGSGSGMTAEAVVQVSLQERQMSKQSVQTAEQLKQEGNQAFKGAHCATVPPPPTDSAGTWGRAQPPLPALPPRRQALCTRAAAVQQGHRGGPEQCGAVRQPRVRCHPAGGAGRLSTGCCPRCVAFLCTAADIGASVDAQMPAQ